MLSHELKAMNAAFWYILGIYILIIVIFMFTGPKHATIFYFGIALIFIDLILIVETQPSLGDLAALISIMGGIAVLAIYLYNKVLYPDKKKRKQAEAVERGETAADAPTPPSSATG